jgi:glycogen synthase kinase 3 beta
LAIDLISKVLKYNPALRPKPLVVLMNPFFDELREEGKKLPNGHDLPEGLFTFSTEEKNSTNEEVIKELVPDWYIKKGG